MKKIISFISAVTVLLGSISCIFSIPLFAVAAATSANNNESAIFDFENGNGFLDFATHWNTYNKDFDGDGDLESAFAEVMTENQGTATENKYLRIQNQYYKNLIVNFPFELENGATYRISYKIRDDGNSNLSQSDTKGSGIYVGKSTGETVLSSNAQRETGNYLGAKLHNLYGDNGSYVSLSKSDFTDVAYTFTVGDDAVDNDFKYLAVNYYCTEKNGSKYEYIDIDDIYIYKLKDNAAFDFESGLGDIVTTAGNAIGDTRITTSVTADGTNESNKVLSFTADSNIAQYPYVNVVFPFELITGVEYKLSYRYRAVKLREANNNIQLNFNSAWSTGKLDNGAAVIQSFTDNDTTQNLDYKNIIAYFAKLPGASQYTSSGGNDWNAFKLYEEDMQWQSVSFTFTASDAYVTDTYNLLALKLGLYMGSSAAACQIDIDDVTIAKVVNLSFDTDGGNTIDDMTVGCGETLNVVPFKDGYEFTGWYDADGNQIFGADGVITVPNKDNTYYAKWKEATDLDDDGDWDGNDLVILKKILIGTVTDYSTLSADRNEDGVVDILDFINLKKTVAGIVPPTEIETTPILSATYKSANATLGNLFDGDLTTCTASPESSTAASGKSIIVNLNGSFNVSSIKLWKNSLGGFPKDFHINVLDGNGWSTVYTAKDVSLNRKYMNVTINKTCAAIEIVADTLSLMTDTSKYALSFAEMKVYGESTDSVFPSDTQLTTLETNPEGNLIQNTLSVTCEISIYDYGKTNATTQNFIYLPKGSVISSTRQIRVAFYDDDYIWRPAWDIYEKRSDCDPEQRYQYRVVEDSFCRIAVNGGFDKTTVVSDEELAAVYNAVTFKVPTDRVDEVYSSDPSVEVLEKYNAEIAATEEAVSQIKYENGVRYAFITDLHANMDAGMRQVDAIVTMVNDLNSDTDTYNDIDFVCLGGDITTGMYTTKEAYFAAMEKILAPLKDLSVPVITLMGNHDDNSYYYMFDWVKSNTAATDDEKNAKFNETVVTKAEWRAAFNNTYGKTVDLVYNTEDENSNYYYFDISNKKTRIVCLDSIDYGVATTKYNGATLYGYGIKQIKWLAETALTADSDWKYIFLSHMQRDMNVYNSSLTKIGADECSLDLLLSAAQNGGSFTYTDGTVTVNRNFADSPTGKICSYQYGHIHADLQFYDEALSIAYLLTGTSGQFSYGAAQTTTAVNTKLTATVPQRIRGKISEALFDITSVSDSAVNVIRFGAVSENGKKNTTYTIE